jgi:predicted flap endonuclease-1-like 5' DNA nuclease
MALSQTFPGAAVVGERAEKAMRLPVGWVSPLWPIFGAAAGVGVAYWWMTQWTKAANVEALMAPLALKPLEKAQPTEILIEPEPVAAAETAAPVVEAPPVEAFAEAEPVAEAIVEAAAEVADDLTRMTGIGPKLSVALAERGVTRFAQIAAWTAQDLADVDAALSLKGRAVREAWVAQAKRLA